MTKYTSYLRHGDDRHFRLDPAFLARYAGRSPAFGYNGLGEFVFYRTYSRTKPDGTKETPTDVFRRVVEGCYEIQRRHCRQLHVPWTLDKAQASAQEMFQRIWDFKFLPPGRGLWMMGTEFMWRAGGAALNNCFAYETEIITRDGIKPIGSLAGTEQELLTRGGKWIKAPINHFGKQELWKVVFERFGIEKVVYTTADHRWFTKSRQIRDEDRAANAGKLVRPRRVEGYQEVLTRNLKVGHHVQSVYGSGICGNVRPSSFGIAHGIAFGDGTTGQESESCGTYIYLCGKKDRELLKFFPNCPSSPDPSKGAEGAIRVADLPRFFRRKPSLHEAKTYLYGWLAGYFAADGSINEDGNYPAISSSDRGNLEFVRELCAVLGVGTYAITSSWKTLKHEGVTKRFLGHKIGLVASHLRPEFFLLSEHRRRFESKPERRNQAVYKWKIKSIESTGDVQDVYCATVPGYGAFALADNILTGNCSNVSTANVEADPADPFCFLMDMSMLGVGVGFDTKGAGKVRVNAPNPALTYVYRIADSREGWVESLRLLIESYTTKAARGRVDFDPQDVRPAGTPIKGFGGVAAGPGILLQLLESIRGLLERRIGQLLSSANIVDLMNLIGRCIVAGNVRRVAELSLGEPDDEEYVTLKNPKAFLRPEDHAVWNAAVGVLYADKQTAATMDDLRIGPFLERVQRLGQAGVQILNGEAGHLAGRAADDFIISADRLEPALRTWNAMNSHRWASNNSLCGRVGMDYGKAAESIAVNGEPGFIWLDNMRHYGRMIDGRQEGIDSRVSGTNPCSEMSLESHELCCLVEVFPAHHEDATDFQRTLKFAYLYAKTVTLLPTHDPRTNQVMLRNRRIGLSQSGIIQAFTKFGRYNVLSKFCDAGYREVLRWDRIYSEWLCVPQSVKRTTVKPSGTVSLVVGATPGIHYPEARCYWRRVRVNRGSVLVKLYQGAGYHIEPAQSDPDGTVIIKFAVDESELRPVNEVTIWEQMENVAAYQNWWSDNQVSCTVKFQPHEVSDIRRVLESHDGHLKSISMLPWRGHGYQQAPYEPCTPEEVAAYNAGLLPVDFAAWINEDTVGSKFCDADTCAV